LPENDGFPRSFSYSLFASCGKATWLKTGTICPMPPPVQLFKIFHGFGKTKADFTFHKRLGELGK